ncbi:MAG: hypothetical protein JO276_07980, partial [Sphingomonadaceae bacterium]|nr:hypothetical protein [Sphingomonadaceae bacterium]
YTGTSFADTFYAGATATTFDGAGGTDTVDYSLSTSGITLTLDKDNSGLVTGTGAGGLAAGDGFSSIERIVGTNYNDVYIITGNNSNSVAFVEAANGGTDEIRTDRSIYVLGSNIENLTNINTSGFTGTGNSLDNVLTGNAGSDRLIGGAGNDTLVGGAGTDVAVFSGLQASYSIVTNGGSVQIVDNQPGTDGDDGTDTVQGIEKAEFKNGVQVSISSPIVLDLDGNGAQLVDRAESSARFDWNGDGRRDATGWVGQGDGFLTLDRDHDGTVSGASELSFVDDKAGAKSDLDGLSAFDSNHDGRLSGADNAWGSFHVWKDANGNGIVDAGEYLSMSEAGVAAINLAGAATARAWGWSDNIVINDGSFVRTDGSIAALADVALNYVASAEPAAPARHPVDWGAELWAEPWAPRFHMPAQYGALIDLDADMRDGTDRGDRFDLAPLAEKQLASHSAVLVGDGPADPADPVQAREPSPRGLDAHLAFGDDGDAGADFMVALGVPRGPGWVEPLDSPMPV